eukprot:COSAG04_NODE_3606_length_2676_cov_1.369810_3_plen_96_part_00
MTAGVSFGSTSSAPRLSSSWLREEAPKMAVETSVLAMDHARASCATVQPCANDDRQDPSVGKMPRQQQQQEQEQHEHEQEHEQEHEHEHEHEQEQ